MHFRNTYREFVRDQQFKNSLEQREAFMESWLDDLANQMETQRQRNRSISSSIDAIMSGIGASSLETTCNNAATKPCMADDEGFCQREEEERRRRLAEEQSGDYVLRL